MELVKQKFMPNVQMAGVLMLPFRRLHRDQTPSVIVVIRDLLSNSRSLIFPLVDKKCTLCTGGNNDEELESKELNAQIRRLQRQIHKYKQDTVYPIQPATQPEKLYIQERMKDIYSVPGLGSSSMRDVYKQSYRMAYTDYQNLSDRGRLKYVTKAKQNLKQYQERMREYMNAYSQTDKFQDFTDKERELRKLKRKKKAAKK